MFPDLSGRGAWGKVLAAGECTSGLVDVGCRPVCAGDVFVGGFLVVREALGSIILRTSLLVGRQCESVAVRQACAAGPLSRSPSGLYLRLRAVVMCLCSYYCCIRVYSECRLYLFARSVSIINGVSVLRSYGA